MWALSALTGLMCVVIPPVPAAATELAAEDACHSTGLVGARVRTAVSLEHHNLTYTKIMTMLTVDLPGSWPLAHDLLLSEQSGPYIEAMACLAGFERDDPRWGEWRPRDPVVTTKGGRVRVVYEAHGWVNVALGQADVGLWQVEVTGWRTWALRLSPPPPLWGSRWDEITVDPGAPGAENAAPDPQAGHGGTALVWRPGTPDHKTLTSEGMPEGLAVTVTVRPPWQRSVAAWSGPLSTMGLDFAGVLLWVITVTPLLLEAVRRYRERPGTPADSQLRTLDNLQRWAWAGTACYLLAAASGPIDLFLQLTSGLLNEDIALIAHVCDLLVPLVLLRFARPPRSVRRAAYALGVGWAAPFALLTVMEAAPGAILVPVRPVGKYAFLDTAIALQSFASICGVALLLVGFAAAAWRLAVDGRLLPPSRRFPGRERRLRLRTAGPAVLVATLAMAVCFALIEERNWRQAGWLMDRGDSEYGEEHREDFLWEVSSAVSYTDDWLIVDHGWLLTSLAVVAVLRTWHNRTALAPLHDPADRLPLLFFFPLAVGLDAQSHMDNTLLEFLWVPLYMLALYGVTALLAPRSGLAQPFEVSRRPLSSVVGPAARRVLLDKARAYREIHAELRRLDQGLFGDEPPKRDALERRLNRLHLWRVNPAHDAAPDRLPIKVSVVDAALALGPRDDWWGNGVRGARLALICGIPAAVLNTWSQWIRGEGWHNTLDDLLGFAGLLSSLVSWSVTFAGAGFVLGALWRVLPGRRGAIKALPVALAFALPVGLDVLVTWFLRESSANVALHVSTMLFVLTVTAIALDLDTFAGERRYWQSRLGLLLSIYQMRYYSLQVAYLIGQVIAIITIWQFFAEPDAVPSSGEAPPAPNDAEK